MNIDEKIALVEKEYRMGLKEQAEQDEKEQGPIYTLAQVREKIRQGFLFLNFDMLKFETMQILDESLKIPFIKDYFDVIEDAKDNTLLASNKFKTALTIVRLPEKKNRDGIASWSKAMKKGMQENHLYCDIKQEKVLKHFDYICYETPTAKGRLYNITFRLIEPEQWYVGTFNCPQEEVFSTGQLFEAFIHEMDDYRNQ